MQKKIRIYTPDGIVNAISSPLKTNGGNDAKDQHMITCGMNAFFKSYDTVIAVKQFGSYDTKVFISPDWNISRTTAQYTRQFLDMNTAEIREAIESKAFTLVDNIELSDKPII